MTCVESVACLITPVAADRATPLRPERSLGV